MDLDNERWNLLNPGAAPKVSYVQQAFKDEQGNVFVASSDFIKAIPDSIARWVPGPMYTLGTDGYGRSDSRSSLRDFFEVDARYITLAALSGLARQGKIGIDLVQNAEKDLGIQPDKKDPITS